MSWTASAIATMVPSGATTGNVVVFANAVNSNGVNFTVLPSAPTGLAATAGNTQVSLTWNASAGASSYNVYSSTTSGGPYTEITSVTALSYTNTGPHQRHNLLLRCDMRREFQRPRVATRTRSLSDTDGLILVERVHEHANDHDQ